MKLTLIRSATLRVEVAGHTLLVDPQLDPAGARDAVPNTPNPRRNPLVDLPAAGRGGRRGRRRRAAHPPPRRPLGRDRARAAAARPAALLPAPRRRAPARRGFTDARPVYARRQARRPADRPHRRPPRHRRDRRGDGRSSPASSCTRPGEPSVYIAGDTILCDEVRAAMAEHAPPRSWSTPAPPASTTGDPIVMTNDDVVALAREFPDAPIVAIHFETVSHATETRADLRARLQAEGLTERVLVPEDGGRLERRRGGRRRRGSSSAGSPGRGRPTSARGRGSRAARGRRSRARSGRRSATGRSCRAARGSASCASPRAGRSRAGAAGAGRRATSGRAGR